MFKIKLKRIIRGFAIIVLLLAVSFAFFLQNNYIVPILMYHSVRPNSNAQDKLCLPPDTFDRQMRFLKQYHYNVISLEELGDLIRSGKKIPFKTVVLTFDDGYKDNYLYAFPVLKKYQLPATIFVIVNEVGRQYDDRLSWEEIGLMQKSGLITFGSHTVNHPWLPELKDEGILANEIFASKRILENNQRIPVNCFSYPGGRFNEKIKSLVQKAGYKLAVATSPGAKYSRDDLFLLKRIRVSPRDANLFTFFVKCSGYYGFAKEKAVK